MEIGAMDANGIYDNNESLKSGMKILMEGCWNTTMDSDGDPVNEGSGPVTANFSYTLAQIMSGAQYNAVKGTGGFTDIYFPDEFSYAYVYKLQSSTVLGKPMSILIYEPQQRREYSYTK